MIIGYAFPATNFELARRLKVVCCEKNEPRWMVALSYSAVAR